MQGDLTRQTTGAVRVAPPRSVEQHPCSTCRFDYQGLICIIGIQESDMNQSLEQRLFALEQILEAVEDSTIPLSDLFKRIQRFAVDIQDPVLELWMHLELYYGARDPFVVKFPEEIRGRVGDLSLDARSIGEYWSEILGPLLAEPYYERARRTGGVLVVPLPIHDIETVLSRPPTSDLVERMYWRVLKNVYNRLRNSVHSYLLELYRETLDSLKKLPPKPPLGFGS